MKGIKIISKTEKGKQAIQQHLIESKKMRWDKRAVFNKLYRQEILNENPYTLSIEIKDRNFQHLIKPKHFCQEIDDALLQNKAIREIDYIIEVE